MRALKGTHTRPRLHRWAGIVPPRPCLESPGRDLDSPVASHELVTRSKLEARTHLLEPVKLLGLRRDESVFRVPPHQIDLRAPGPRRLGPRGGERPEPRSVDMAVANTECCSPLLLDPTLEDPRSFLLPVLAKDLLGKTARVSDRAQVGRFKSIHDCVPHFHALGAEGGGLGEM